MEEDDGGIIGGEGAKEGDMGWWKVDCLSLIGNWDVVILVSRLFLRLI